MGSRGWSRIKYQWLSSGPEVVPSVNEIANSPLHISLSYSLEGMALLGEGLDAMRLESAATQAGYPLGPLALIDLLSLSVADELLHAGHAHTGASPAAAEGTPGKPGHMAAAQGDHAGAHKHTHGHGAADIPSGEPERHGHDGHAHDHSDHHHHQHHHHQHDHKHDHHHHDEHHDQVLSIPEPAIYVIEKMSHGFDRRGKAEEAGFYDYDDGEMELWSGLSAFRRRGVEFSGELVVDRLRYVVLAAAIRSMPDPGTKPGKAHSDLPSDWLAKIDGPDLLRQWRDVDPQAILSRADELEHQYGPRFHIEPGALSAWFNPDA